MGGAGSLAWFIFLKNGFFVSAPKEDEGVRPGAGGADGGLCIGTGGGLVRASDSAGVDFDSGNWMLPSRDSTWLFVGVVSCGVISWGPSSDESSSPRLSNCNCSCLSLSFAASSSARWAASLASFSFASFSAACFLRFSSCFLTLPCLTCSSKALSLA